MTTELRACPPWQRRCVGGRVRCESRSMVAPSPFTAVCWAGSRENVFGKVDPHQRSRFGLSGWAGLMARNRRNARRGRRCWRAAVRVRWVFCHATAWA